MAKVRQAIVMIHGMGEQRALDTLRSGAFAAVPERGDGWPRLISRPDKVTDGPDSRRYLAAPVPWWTSRPKKPRASSLGCCALHSVPPHPESRSSQR